MESYLITELKKKPLSVGGAGFTALLLHSDYIFSNMYNALHFVSILKYLLYSRDFLVVKFIWNKNYFPNIF